MFEIIFISLAFLIIVWVLIIGCEGATLDEIDDYCRHLEDNR